MKQTTILTAATLLALTAAATVGCRGDRSEAPPRQFFPDMDDQPKVKAQVKSTFFNEFEPEYYGEYERWGRASRLPVDNTVPFGNWPITTSPMNTDFAQRQALLRNDPEIYQGRTENGTVIEDIPIPVTEELLALGQKNYNIYCIACHGGTGAGDGLVGRVWIAPVPSYHQAQYQKGAGTEQSPDGHLFDVIRNGVQNPPGIEPRYRMRPYGSKVNAEEAWAIVAYIRALQMTRRGTLEMIDDDDRNRLIQERNRAFDDQANNDQNAARANAIGDTP